MTTPEAGNGVEEQPEIYIDVSSWQQMVGKAAVEQHVEWGGHPADIVPLGEAIRNFKYQIPERKDRSTEKPTRKEIIRQVQFLLSILPEPDSPHKMKLNEKIIQRASNLNLIATIWQIQQEFGRTGNLYVELGVTTARKFPDLTPEAAKKYVYDLFIQKGRMPTKEEIDQEADKDLAKPRYQVLNRRLPGGLKKLRLEEGFDYAKDTSHLGITLWGLAFRKINGRLPAQIEIGIMSTVGKSVSASTVTGAFHNSLQSFHEVVEATYEQWENIEEIKKQEVKQGIKSGAFPIALAFETSNNYRNLTRVARFQILRRFMPDAPIRALVKVVTQDYSDATFIKLMRRINQNVDEAIVSEIALDLGYTGEMWRKIRTDLNLVDAIEARMAKERGPLTEDERERYEAILGRTVDFLIVNQLDNLQDSHIEFLQRKKVVPKNKSRLFKKMFYSPKYFKILAREQARFEYEEIRNLESSLIEEIDAGIECGKIPRELFLNVFVSPLHRATGNANAAAHIQAMIEGNPLPKFLVKEKWFVIQKRPLSRHQIILRYAKWKFTNEFIERGGFNSLPPADIVIMSVLERSRLFCEDILAKARRRGAKADMHDIEELASMTGLSRYILPQDRYISRLKLPYRRVRK